MLRREVRYLMRDAIRGHPMLHREVLYRCPLDQYAHDGAISKVKLCRCCAELSKMPVTSSSFAGGRLEDRPRAQEPPGRHPSPAPPWSATVFTPPWYVFLFLFAVPPTVAYGWAAAAAAARMPQSTPSSVSR